MKDLISIIIPVYNVENYIEKCLESLLHQTYENIQIILVDDGSSDESGIICDRYADRDSRICVLHQNNQGVSQARNYGLSVADGKYIGFCDADDWVEPDMYEYLYQLLSASGKSIASCGAWLDSGKSSQPAGYSLKKVLNLDAENAIAELHIRRNTSVWIFTKLFERSVLTNLQFDKDLKISEDYVYMCKAIENSSGMVCGTEIKYHYIQRKDSAVNKGYTIENEKAIEAVKHGVDYYRRIFPDKEKEIMSFYILELMGLLTAMIKGGRMEPGRIKEVRKILRSNLLSYLCTSGPELYFKGSAVLICINFQLFVHIYQKLKKFH